MTVGGWLLAGKAHIDHDRVLAGGAVHPRAELLQGQPPIPGGRAERLKGRIPLGVRRADAGGWLAVGCGCAVVARSQAWSIWRWLPTAKG